MFSGNVRGIREVLQDKEMFEIGGRERVHCNYKQTFIVLLFYQGGWNKIRLIYNTITVDLFSNNRYLELCLNSNNLSSFLVI